MRKDLTIGEVAQLLGVARNTAKRWYAEGFFKGTWTLPLNSTRRIPRWSVAEFCRERGIPVPAQLVPRVLLVKCGHLEEVLQPLLGPVAFTRSETTFEAGLAVASGGVFATVLDLAAVGSEEARSLARVLHGELYQSYTLALVPAGRPAQSELVFSKSIPADTPPSRVAGLLQDWLHGSGMAGYGTGGA